MQSLSLMNRKMTYQHEVFEYIWEPETYPYQDERAGVGSRLRRYDGCGRGTHLDQYKDAI